ncbi:unnamed protein product, partial [Phaeothamnion confervicola]
LLGESLVGLGRPDLSIAHFVRATAVDPGNATIRRRHGAALIALGRLADAAAVLEPALLAGDPSPTLDLLMRGDDKPSIAVAETLLRRATAAHPAEPTIWRALGAVLRRQGRIEEALVCYRR